MVYKFLDKEMDTCLEISISDTPSNERAFDLIAFDDNQIEICINLSINYLNKMREALYDIENDIKDSLKEKVKDKQ